MRPKMAAQQLDGAPPLRSGLYRPPRAGISDRHGQPEVTFGAILALAGRPAHLEAVRRTQAGVHQLSSVPSICGFPTAVVHQSGTQSG